MTRQGVDPGRSLMSTIASLLITASYNLPYFLLNYQLECRMKQILIWAMVIIYVSIGKAVVPCQNKIILKNFRPVGRPS